ncbi:MAG TPA: methyltransferase domain-containing protein [Rubrobacteraceae bacterium]|nr:methyltransferase domain-containing protein [Rubrobacteraceae bacterium]
MIDKIYQTRFDSDTVAAKKELWNVLVEQFLQRYVPTDAAVADIGGGYCEFINAVRCRQKYVVDLNPDVHKYAAPDVEILLSDASDIDALPNGGLDVAFVSNFFEHLPSKQQLFEVLAEINRTLGHGGKLLIIQPNIKYAYREYWDFIDHHIALTESSLGEALAISGFEITECIPRFLPFSVKSSPSRSSKLLSLYLKAPPAWRIFGKQTFMVGTKS